MSKCSSHTLNHGKSHLYTGFLARELFMAILSWILSGNLERGKGPCQSLFPLPFQLSTGTLFPYPSRTNSLLTIVQLLSRVQLL